MIQHKDLREFDIGQIGMARQLGRSVSKTADLWGIPRLQWSVFMKSCPRKEQRRGSGRPRLSNEHEEQSEPTDELA